MSLFHSQCNGLNSNTESSKVLSLQLDTGVYKRHGVGGGCVGVDAFITIYSASKTDNLKHPPTLSLSQPTKLRPKQRPVCNL